MSAPSAPDALPQYEPQARHGDALGGATSRAVIREVVDGSPAWDAGLDAGMVLTHVNGVVLTDMIEWQWQADGSEVEVTLEGGETALLERDWGQEWGLSFTDCLFDSIRTCCNACTFCFMTMLPKGMRSTLYLRDDDYRLSFLQGNFVTLTNVTEEDLEKILSRHLSPLHVSVHAVDADVRRALIGRNAGRGMEVLQRLLEAGIEVHAQLVLVPHVNDGPVLVQTLGWLERYPSVLSVGIVPLGYTRFQKRFTESYSDDPAAAAMVIDIVREFQEDSRRDTRVTRYHIADEFYLAAGEEFPPAAFYDGYPQFHDGIGMMRAFIDEWEGSTERLVRLAQSLAPGPPATVVTGTAFARVLGSLVAVSPLAGLVDVLPVDNAFFGGNVDVSGLLTASDIAPALAAARPAGRVLVPREAFNADMLMLDGSTLDQLRRDTACDIVLCTYSPDGIIRALG